MTALSGTRVVCLATNLPGPAAAARLLALGAQVTKIEPPQGDLLARAAPGWYDELTSGEDVLVLDLKEPEDRERLEGHLATADILVTSMRPSALGRLGLQDVTERHPGLVHVEIVGHGGAMAEVPGHDLTYQAAEGTLHPPHMPLVPVADLLGAERAVSGALAALISRQRTGRGGRVRITLEEAAHAAGGAVRHGLMGPGGVLGGAAPTYRIYRSADGYVALGALEPHFADQVHQHLGSTAGELTAVFAAETSAHWEGVAADLGIPLVAVALGPDTPWSPRA